MENKKNLLIILGVALIIAVAVFLFLNRNKDEETKQISDKTLALKQTMVEKKCSPEIIAEATKFLEDYPEASDVWVIKGTCEFDLGKFDEAKISFEKVLSLEPNNVSAKNHLELLTQKQGRQVLNDANISQYQISRQDFESRLKITIDPKLLSFKDAIKRPIETGITEYIAANYEFLQSTSAVKQALKKSLAAAHLNYTIHAQGGPENWEIKADSKHAYAITFWDTSLTFDYVVIE